MNLDIAYQVLQIEPTSDVKKIKKAYYKLAKEYHPDRLKLQPDATEADFKKMDVINEAFEVINKSLSGEDQSAKIVSIFDEMDDIFSVDEGASESVSEVNDWFESNLSASPTQQKKVNKVVNISEAEAKSGTTKMIYVDNPFTNTKDGLEIKIPRNTLTRETLVVEQGDIKYILMFNVE